MIKIRRYTTVYEETLTGRPHDTSVQMWMQFNVMPRTHNTKSPTADKHWKYSLRFKYTEEPRPIETLLS